MERKEIEALVRKHMAEKLESAGEREYIVAANWKMNLSEKEIKDLLGQITKKEAPEHLKTILFSPYPYLHILKKMLRYSRITYGAQDVAKEEKGAFTGEVSAGMLLDMGCSYTLTGHSERRSYYGETPEIVAKKTAAALRCGITPVVCIGETLEERRSERFQDVLKMQIGAVHQEIGEQISECIIAYEPVWAIGTGVVPEMTEIADTHRFIHETLVSGNTKGKAPKLLYGGSVNEKNVRAIAEAGYVDGFLIGGASLKAESFNNILRLLSVD